LSRSVEFLKHLVFENGSVQNDEAMKEFVVSKFQNLELIYENLTKLRDHATDVESRIPIMTYKTNDDLLQMKYFIRTYY
jgi:hypothetical protein